MDLKRITPCILTYNEEPNIGRTLDQLTWAEQILIVDSYSTDATFDILEEYAQAEVVQRSFSNFAEQWNFAVGCVETEWALCLDADYVLSDELVEEIRALDPTHAAYTGQFVYCVFGKQLRGSLYPPRPVLTRSKNGHFVQDGHTQRLKVKGELGRLKEPIYHDDRKPLTTWLAAQKRYASQEVEKLQSMPSEQIDFLDRIRSYYLAPFLVPPYCLLWKRLILDGRAGLYYTLQRTYAELLLALCLLDHDLRRSSPDDG